jgi:hypothetical protein
MKMKQLSPEEQMMCGIAGYGVLRTLKRTGQSMPYHEFLIAIGIVADGEPWKIWMRDHRVKQIVMLMSALDPHDVHLDWSVLYDSATGKPGVNWNTYKSRLVRIAKEPPTRGGSREPAPWAGKALSSGS